MTMAYRHLYHPYNFLFKRFLPDLVVGTSAKAIVRFFCGP